MTVRDVDSSLESAWFAGLLLCWHGTWPQQIQVAAVQYGCSVTKRCLLAELPQWMHLPTPSFVDVAHTFARVGAIRSTASLLSQCDAEQVCYRMNEVNLAWLQVAVAFRGTEVSKPQDIWTDLQLTPAIFTYDAEESPDKDGDPVPRMGMFLGGSRQPAVHSGFLKGWRSVQEAVEEVVDCASDGEQGWKLYACGHSLGGALAVLAAASFAANGCGCSLFVDV